MGSNLGSGRNSTEVRPLSKAPNPQLLPGVLQVCVHLDGLNTENTFHCWLYSVYICDKYIFLSSSELKKKLTLLFAELPDLQHSVNVREVRTPEYASPKFAYLVLRNTCRPNVKSPDYLPNLLGILDGDGNADSNRSEGKQFHGTYFSW